MTQVGDVAVALFGRGLDVRFHVLLWLLRHRKAMSVHFLLINLFFGGKVTVRFWGIIVRFAHFAFSHDFEGGGLLII